jgi:hypothetical protein
MDDPALSVTVTVNEAAPTTVRVPETAELEKLSPGEPVKPKV